jgi:hypothetical protein
MPFRAELSPVLATIRQVVEREGTMSCVRADDIYSDGIVIDEIWERICAAQFLIADMTDRNPNVFYEIGLAHALGKHVVILAQSEVDVPFDLRHRRVILYDIGDLGALDRQLTGTIGQLAWKTPQVAFWASTDRDAIRIGLQDLTPGCQVSQSPVEARGRVLGIPMDGLSHSIQAFVRTDRVYEQGSGLLDADGGWRIDQVHFGARRNSLFFRIFDEAGRTIVTSKEIVVSKVTRS